MKDDATLWMESQGQDIQDYEVPENPIETNPETGGGPGDKPDGEEPRHVTAAEVSDQLNLIKINEPMATTIVGLMDVLVPLLVVMLIKGTDEERMKLTSSERQTLVEAWAQYLCTKQVNVSPGLTLLVTIATIYGAKFYLAVQERKERKETERLNAEVERLRHELEAEKQLREIEGAKHAKEEKEAQQSNGKQTAK